MFGPWLELLTAAVLWLAAAALTAAAAMRCARASLYAPPFGLSELYLRFFLILAMLTAWPVALLGFAGWLGPAGLLLLGAVFFLGSRLLPERPHGVTVLRRRGKRLRLLGVPLVAALAILAVDLPLYLAAPPIRWDAMTYHLYFPARWIQEGQIHHIPTVFSDNSAAFAPQNGALLFAWSMALLGSDALCNVMQLLALAAVGCAVYRLSRELGSAPGAAALAAATLFWVRPLRQVVLSANVDGWMLAFWIAGLAWLVAYVRRGRLDLLLACALATGFAAGTKTIGLPLAAAHLVVLLAATMARRRPAHASALFAAAAAGGGWWLLRNAALYSNPLFPLHLELGPWALRGAYGVEALRAGEFHLEDPGAVLTFVFSYWGPPRAYYSSSVCSGSGRLSCARCGGARSGGRLWDW